MRVLAISGSLRRGSYNTKLLRAAVALAPEGLEIQLAHGLDEIPAYNDDRRDRPPEAVVGLREQIAAADGVLVATPEYNSSIPGHLKNAFDWLSRPLASSPLRFKPAAVTGASTGLFGAIWSQAETRKVLAAIGARVVETELAVPNADELLAGEELADPDLRDGLEALVRELVELIEERERAGRTTAGAEEG